MIFHLPLTPNNLFVKESAQRPEVRDGGTEKVLDQLSGGRKVVRTEEQKRKRQAKHCRRGSPVTRASGSGAKTSQQYDICSANELKKLSGLNSFPYQLWHFICYAQLIRSGWKFFNRRHACGGGRGGKEIERGSVNGQKYE